jgi:hypothetical protein
VTYVFLFFYLSMGDIANGAVSQPHVTWAECEESRRLYEHESAVTSECFKMERSQ